MLTRQSIITPPEKIISDNLTHKPDVAQSAWDNFSLGQVTAPYILNTINKEFNESPRGQTLKATFEALKRGNENPEVGWVQWGVNEASNMLGQALSPLGFLFAEAGGLAVKPLTMVGAKIAPTLFKKPIAELLGETMGKYFPETIGTAAGEQTLSLGLFGKELTKGFGIGAGATLPQATLDNFNAETNKHDIFGMAKGMGMGGVFGMTLGTIPFAWGILKANVNRYRGKPPTDALDHAELDKMVEEGHFNKEQAQFIKDLDDYKNNPDRRSELKVKLQGDATKFVDEQGHPVDHANDTAQFEILNRDQINNLQSTTIDQLVSDNIPEEHRTALTDFTVQAGIDEMRNKTGLLDGVRGYVEYADHNLANKDTILANADKIVDEHLKLQELFRGYPGEKHGFKPISVSEKELQIHDFEFGKGYWYAETEKHAKAYGADIETVTGHYKIFDVDNNNDKELSESYKKIQDEFKFQEENKTKKHTNEIDNPEKLANLVEEFRKILQEKGYQGIRRLETKVDQFGIRTGGGRKHEIMFFEKPIGIQDHAFTQHALFDIAKKSGKNNQLPFTLPKEVQERIKQENRISEIERKNEKLFSAYEKTGNSEYTDQMKKNNEEIEKLKSELVPLKSAMDELQDIRKKLIPVKNNVRQKKEYQRLADLAEVWNPAKTLLDRINLEADIRSQEAYRDLAKQMLDIADSNVGAMAKVENINGYMEARTKQRIDEHNPKSELIELAREHEVPADADTIIAEHDRIVEETDHKLTKEEYEKAKDKFKEFKQSEGIFKNFINCVLGSQK